jgi:hypothetical protein
MVLSRMSPTRVLNPVLKRVFIATAAAAALVASGCARYATTCQVSQSAIQIRVIDSVTGALGPFENVYALAVGTTFRDSVLTREILPSSAGAGGPKPIQLGFDEPDTYQVTVTADGYKPWVKSNVNAPAADACPHPVTQTITAKLVATP